MVVMPLDPQHDPLAGPRLHDFVAAQFRDRGLQNARIAGHAQIAVAEFHLHGHVPRGDFVVQRVDRAGSQRGEADRLRGQLALRMLEFTLLPLQRPHFRVHAVTRQQFPMRALFDHAAMLHHENPVRVHHGGKPMRDHDRRAALCEACQFGLDRAFGARVERRRRLVENDNARVFQNGASNRDALTLTPRQAHATFADAGVVMIRQPLDELVQLCGTRGAHDIRTRGGGPPVRNVVGNRLVEQHGVLRHDADGFAQALLRHLAQILAVDPDGATVGLIEPEQELHNGRLARPAAADHGQRLARIGMEIDIAQDRPRRVVAKVHVLEVDLADAHDQRLRGGFVDVLAHSPARRENREHALDVDHRVISLAKDEAERIQGHADLNQVRINQNQIPDTHGAAHHTLRREQHDRRNAERNHRALSNMQRGQRTLIRRSGVYPLFQHFAEPPCFCLLGCEVLDGVVVQQTVDQPPVRFRLEQIDSALKCNPPPRENERIDRVAAKGGGNRQCEFARVAAHHDRDDRRDLKGRRHDGEQGDAQQKADTVRAFLYVAHDCAGFSPGMKPRAHTVQVRERSLGECGHGSLRDDAEDHIAGFVERVAEEAQQRICQYQKNGK
ncbi:P-loop containing nucleoside triphosphate hydrolase protein, partial [Aureobasidium melanogenum]